MSNSGEMNNPIDIVMESNPTYTMEKIASIMGVTRQTLNSYKNNPSLINVQQLYALSQETGISMENLLGTAEMKKGPSIPPKYEKASSKLSRAIRSAEIFLNEINTTEVDGRLKTAIRRKEEIIDELENLILSAKDRARKPMVCAFGPSDAGKSTLGNFILGKRVIPAEYTPMTSAPTYYMHISEKPEGVMDGIENTVVYKRNKREKKSGNAAIQRHYEYLTGDKSNVIKTGVYKDLLTSFGTRKGDYFRSNDYDIDEIDVFLDLPILKEITFVDFPGFGSGMESDDISLTMDVSAFDIIFILSQSNAFLRGNEISAIVNIFRHKEAGLSGIYLLATHANAVGKPEKLEEIKHAGCLRIVNAMAEDEKKRLQISENNFSVLKKRCYCFDPNYKHWCEDINSELEKNVPKIIKERLDRTNKELCDTCTKLYKEYVNKVKKVRVKSRRGACSDEERKAMEKRIHFEKERGEAIKNTLLDSIKIKEAYCLDQLEKRYYEVVSESYIESVINKKNIKNNKQGIELLASYLSEELNEACSKPMKKTSKEFSNEVKNELDQYKSDIDDGMDIGGVHIDMSDFNFTRAFASGLTGVAAYGALAVWANAVAAGSNLGAYILVAKIVSALSALGISVGGTGAVAAFVASIGGPVTIGIALAILSAVAVFGIFTGTWKTRVARKLISAYKDNNTLTKMKKNVKAYWKDTERAVVSCVDALQQNVEEHIKNQFNEGMTDEEIFSANEKILYLNKECAKFYEVMTEILE